MFLLALFCAGLSPAQLLSVGVIGGAPFADIVKSDVFGALQSIPDSSNFTVGPSVRIGLPLNLRFEVDALYRPYSFRLSSPLQAIPGISGNQWRFPVLLQYRFSAPVINPFIEGGLSYENLSGLSNAANSITSGPGAVVHKSTVGVVLGAGVDLKVPLVRISGELRYTRQTASNFNDISNLNQAEFLVGVHF